MHQSCGLESFWNCQAYPDRHKAQQVTIRLMERLNEAEFAERFGPDGLKSAGVMANVALPNKLESAGLIDIRGTGPSADEAIKHLASLANDAFSPEALKRLIEENYLYPKQRAKQPLEDVIEQMRHDIRLEPRSGSAIQVSFTYPDRNKAQQVMSKLMQSLSEAEINFMESGGSGDQKPEWTLRGEASIPPQAASSPARMNPMGVGLGGGLLLGLSVSFVCRWLRQGRA